MRVFIITTAVLALIIVGGLVFIFGMPTAAQAMHVDLTSSPFPLAVAGMNTLMVQLHNSDGSPVSDATINVRAAMNMVEHLGMVPDIVHSADYVGDGTYEAPMIFSMPGPWLFTVDAQLADGSTRQESYAIYIYAVGQSARSTNLDLTYRSVRDSEIANGDTDRELRILIPLGSAMEILQQEGMEIIPSEIRLDVDGRNTLVIQNDDIIDHQVGPFFVRAGETIRQEFIRPAEFVGTCTARHDGTLSIIVE